MSGTVREGGGVERERERRERVWNEGERERGERERENQGLLILGYVGWLVGFSLHLSLLCEKR